MIPEELLPVILRDDEILLLTVQSDRSLGLELFVEYSLNDLSGCTEIKGGQETVTL
jgi:hypothetical protein